MGDWWLGNDNRWHYDDNAGAPDPAVTSMLPIVTPTPYPRTGGTVRYGAAEDHQLSRQEGPEHPGGDWANADAYLSYDDVDSTTIVDDGAPA